MDSPPGAAGSDRPLVVLVALVLTGLVTFGVYLARLAPAEVPELGEAGRILRVPRELPAFDLIDHRGEPFDRARLVGGWSLLFFGYTSCPDVCPLTLQGLASARREAALRTRSTSAFPEVVFVSVDPQRDPVERLAEYVAYFDPAFLGVTGEARAVDPLVDAVGAFYRAEVPADAPDAYRVDHTAFVFLVGPDAHLRAVLEEPHDPAEFLDTLAIVQSLEKETS